jgi:ribonuclease Y
MMGPIGIVATIVAAILFGALGVYVGYQGRLRLIGQNTLRMEESAKQVLADAHSQARAIEVEGEKRVLDLQREAEAEIKERTRELSRQENRMQQRREALDKRIDSLDGREKRIRDVELKLEERQRELDNAWNAHLEALERVSGLSQEEAKEMLLEQVRDEARVDAARIIREITAEAREEGDTKAREIITTAIQRVAADHVSETTVSTVELPSDDMKGRIIGRGGRNIRAIEAATGVDLVIDDTPDTVILSSFDPVRREVARLSLLRLIVDGRIHPGRIESVIEKAREEVEQTIREKGEEAALELGVHGLPPDILRILGRLHYRTSYGQNVLQHSIETAMLCGMMAAELGGDVETAKMAGLLHDLGKAVDHEVDGPHAIIGAEIAERYGLPEKLVNAIGSHHCEMEQCSCEAVLVQAADAISSARPGARRESLEGYLKRIRALEQVANSFEGVESSYAIQAGREIRILVKPEQIDDLGAIELSREIARKVEESLQYPGQIRVTVIRETRATEIAK